jgi:hypothetical protein
LAADLVSSRSGVNNVAAAGGYDARMCSNYQPVSRQDRLLTFVGVERVIHES